MIHKKQLENVKYLNYFGSIITNDARCTREIKCRISIKKIAFNKKALFTSKLDLNLNKKTREMTFWLWLCNELKLGHFKNKLEIL
jgi:hypothetical protein